MSNTANKKPSHFIYTVREGGENSTDYWTKIGVAFEHNDNKGFSLLLDAMPFDGKLSIRKPEPKDKSDA